MHQIIDDAGEMSMRVSRASRFPSWPPRWAQTEQSLPRSVATGWFLGARHAL